MYAAVKTIATILSLSFFIDRLGRRKLLLTSSVGTSLALWYIGAFVTAKHIDLMKPQEKTVAGWVAIVCVYVYAVSPLICFILMKIHSQHGIDTDIL
jgi:MFS family permease